MFADLAKMVAMSVGADYLKDALFPSKGNGSPLAHNHPPGELPEEAALREPLRPEVEMVARSVKLDPHLTDIDLAESVWSMLAFAGPADLRKAALEMFEFNYPLAGKLLAHRGMYLDELEAYEAHAAALEAAKTEKSVQASEQKQARDAKVDSLISQRGESFAAQLSAESIHAAQVADARALRVLYGGQSVVVPNSEVDSIVQPLQRARPEEAQVVQTVERFNGPIPTDRLGPGGAVLPARPIPEVSVMNGKGGAGHAAHDDQETLFDATSGH